MPAFTVGNTQVHHVEEWQGPFATPAQLFAGFDPEKFATFLSQLPPGTYLREEDSVYAFLQSWVLEHNGLVVLYDTGAGNAKDRPGIPVFGQLETPFLERLKAAGFAPEDIDIVINSHLHIDHMGWNTVFNDDSWVPTFPNARYLFSRIDCEYWDPRADDPQPTEGGRLVNTNVFEDSVQPLLDRGLVELVDDGYEVAPGLTLDLYPGHTPGHLVLELSEGGESALFVGDILHHPAQVYCPDWNSVYCEDQAGARASRLRVLERAADKGSRVVPAHFGACHYAWIDRNDGGFRPRYEP